MKKLSRALPEAEYADSPKNIPILHSFIHRTDADRRQNANLWTMRARILIPGIHTPTTATNFLLRIERSG
jgi:hypothetical protein